MQGNNDNFQKSQKKNRRFDDGLTKQTNPKKFKATKRNTKQGENQP